MVEEGHPGGEQKDAIEQGVKQVKSMDEFCKLDDHISASKDHLDGLVSFTIVRGNISWFAPP